MTLRKLTQQDLKKRLVYDEDCGEFRWIHPSTKLPAGRVTNSKNVYGYIQINIEGHVFLAHRLAWLYVYGVWPKTQLDHIDRDRTNNAINNLREVSHKQNAENAKMRVDNTSGFRGVTYRPSSNKWIAQIQSDGRNYYLGSFSTPNEASDAYENARNTLFTHHKG